MTSENNHSMMNSATNQTSPRTFADVLLAVDAAVNLSPGVRGNLRSAVERCARLMGAQGVAREIDVQSIASMLGKVTAAKIGFKNHNSLAAFRSNLRRGLRLAGIEIMDGKARNLLQPPWSQLAERIQGVQPFLWIPLSRFIHFASAQGWGAVEIDARAFEQFQLAIYATSLDSKAEKTVRNTAKAWDLARATITGWPQADLGYQRRRAECVIRPWSDFPSSLEADAKAFVTRDDLDVDDFGEEDPIASAGRKRLNPLKARTQQNYLDGIRRAAAMTVDLGVELGDIRCLSDLVVPERVREILKTLRARTKREKGGHAEFMAVLLLVIARDYVRVCEKQVAHLTKLWKAVHQRGMAMSERSHARLRQFDDDDAMDRFLLLPDRMMAMAEAKKVASITSAKLARAALFLRILLDTASRQGNIVGLNLDSQVIIEGEGKKLRAWVNIAGTEVKNGVPIRAELSYDTARMLLRYTHYYRIVHCDRPSNWLFPRHDGSHWTPGQACADLKDLASRYVGLDVTPHSIRSIAGKILLDAHPGALGEVQGMLGHRSVRTTEAHYAPINREKVRGRYQNLLNKRRRGE